MQEFQSHTKTRDIGEKISIKPSRNFGDVKTMCS